MLVSFIPRAVEENIPGLNPDWYRLDASVNGIPEVLIIKPGFYMKPGLEGTSDKIEVSSKEIAESLVRQYTTSQVSFAPDSKPALIAIPEELSIPDMLKKYSGVIQAHKVFQKNWFMRLVKIADDDWIISHRHGVISDLQRSAARELNFNRDWLIEIPDDLGSKPECPACGFELLKKDAPVCPNCKTVINAAKYAALKLATV